MSPLNNAHAVIIGVGAYDSVAPLPDHVTAEARTLAGLVTDPQRCGYPDDNVALLLDHEATGTTVRQALSDLAGRANKFATALIYFSGHGVRRGHGQEATAYLLPVDARADDLAGSAISGGEFSTLLSAIAARRVLVIFDCCHAGGIGTPKDALAAPAEVGLPDAYYNRLAVGMGRVIIASSRATEKSWIMPGDAQSLFSKHLFAGLDGGVDGPDGLIRVFDLFNYVQPRVTEEQPQQHPLFKAEIESNFPVAMRVGGAPTAVSPPPDDRFVYDVFISYGRSPEDRRWVRNVLVPYLKGAGIRFCVDYECFQLARPQLLEMERAVIESRYTLAILSQAYLDNAFSEIENVMADHLGLESGQYRLLGVFREQCQPRLGLRTRMLLDMTDAEEFDFNMKRLMAQLLEPPVG